MTLPSDRRTVGAHWRPSVCRRIVTSAIVPVKLGKRILKIVSTPDNHFRARPNCRVPVTFRRCSVGVHWPPSVGRRIVTPPIIPIDAIVSAPNNHLAARPHRRVFSTTGKRTVGSTLRPRIARGSRADLQGRRIGLPPNCETGRGYADKQNGEPSEVDGSNSHEGFLTEVFTSLPGNQSCLNLSFHLRYFQHEAEGCQSDFPSDFPSDLPSDLPYVGTPPGQIACMAAALQKQLGEFLRNRRREMTLPAFARKLGISTSSLHRMEMGEQNVTLKSLEHLLKRLKCNISDIFNDAKN
jgi:DNA-binding Xre family transcriptional regulator